MELCILGDSAYGLEYAYLAKKAGCRVTVVSPTNSFYSKDFIDEYININLMDNLKKTRDSLESFDAIIPAIDDLTILKQMHLLINSEKKDLFDLATYTASSSNNIMSRVFEGIGIPTPIPWPSCGFPVLAKPSKTTCDFPTEIIENSEDLNRYIKAIRSIGEEPTIHEYLSGKYVSVDVLGNEKGNVLFPINELEYNSDNDICRTYCDEEYNKQRNLNYIRKISRNLAEVMALNGFMSIKGTFIKNNPCILDMDGRISLMTPLCTLACSGINLLEEQFKSKEKMRELSPKFNGCAICEHVVVSNGKIRSGGVGEFHRIFEPSIKYDLFGVDEMITDYTKYSDNWRGMLILRGNNREDVEEKRNNCIDNIISECKLKDEDLGHLRSTE